MMGVESAIAGNTGTAGVMSSPAKSSEGSNSEASDVSNIQSTGEEVQADSAVKETKAKGSKSSVSGKPSLSPEESAGAAAVPEFKPSHKFRHKDKELDFEDWAKSAAKDAKTEERIRELYQKAAGLDDSKQDRQTLKSELAEAKERIATTDRAIETISGYARERDWDSFFEALSIPKNEVLQYALQLVQREQMPPDQRAQWESARQAQQAAKYYELQNQQLQQSQQQFKVEQRELQLQTELSKPDISQVATAYNVGMGDDGAFREFVIRIGQAHAVQGRDISPAEAVQEAVRHLRAMNPGMGAQAVAQAAEAPLKVVQPSSKPVIPNIQGRGTSPVKQVVKSLDDLRARAKEIDSRV